MKTPAFSAGQPATFFNAVFEDIDAGLMCLNKKLELEWATDTCGKMFGVTMHELEGYGYTKVIQGLAHELSRKLSLKRTGYDVIALDCEVNNHEFIFRCRSIEGEGYNVTVQYAPLKRDMPESIQRGLQDIEKGLEELKHGRRKRD